MSAGLTPTTEYVREFYAKFHANLELQPDYEDEVYARAEAEFDRWLAARDAETWDACLDAIEQNELNTQQAREGNPYRRALAEKGTAADAPQETRPKVHEHLYGSHWIECTDLHRCSLVEKGVDRG